MAAANPDLSRRRLMTFEAKLRQGHNFLTAVSAVYTDLPQAKDLTTTYDMSVDTFCDDLRVLISRVR